jgi:CBS domain-containing protein
MQTQDRERPKRPGGPGKHPKHHHMAKRNSGNKKVEAVAGTEPQPLPPESPLNQAGKEMRKLATEKFPVAAEGRLIGTLEGRFPDRQAAGFGHDPSTLSVGESMKKDLFYCFENQTTAEAKKIMQDNGLQYLPVVDGDLRIIGMLALKEL